MTRPTPAALAASVLMAALLVLAWWWPNRPQLADMPMPVERFNSVSFAPFRAGHSPLTNTVPTAAEVEAGVRAIERRLLRWLDAGAPEGAADGTGRDTT